MKRITGRTSALLILAAMLSTAVDALADAPAWVRGMAGGPDVALSMTSIDDTDRSLRDFARSARIDWLPTAGRLLGATKLAPGIDTTKPIAFGFIADEADGSLSVRFLAVIPADRPATIAANFEATPSPQHAGLFAFAFAGRNYFARALPDGHFAISDSPEILLDLTKAAETLDDDADLGPIRLELQGDDAPKILAALLGAASIDGDSSPTTGEEIVWPEGVDSLIAHLAPTAEAVTVRLRVRATNTSEQAETWTPAPGGSHLGKMPFPNTDAMFVAQGSITDAASRDVLGFVTESVLGLDADDLIDGIDSFAVLVEAPENLFNIANIGVSLAFTSQDAQALRTRISATLSDKPGITVSPNSSTRVGTSIDRLTISGSEATPARPNRPGFRGMMPRPAASQSAIEARMFTRGDRVYLTTTKSQNVLDLLIAFGPDSKAIESRDHFSQWLDRLPTDAGSRLLLDIRTFGTFAALGAGAQGSRITVPETLPPIVASIRTGDSEVEAIMIAPIAVIDLLEQLRRASGEIAEQRR